MSKLHVNSCVRNLKPQYSRVTELVFLKSRVSALYVFFPRISPLSLKLVNHLNIISIPLSF